MGKIQSSACFLGTTGQSEDHLCEDGRYQQASRSHDRLSGKIHTFHHEYIQCFHHSTTIDQLHPAQILQDNNEYPDSAQNDHP